MAAQPSQKEVPEDYLLSDSDGEVRMVTVTDQGSHPKCAHVLIQGVPTYGIIDSGADITIMGGTLFKRVAAQAKLRKSQLLKANKIPYTYDGKPFMLDGLLQLDVTFEDHTINTTVYLKMDANEQLLMSEGVCWQLGILSYHPKVEKVKRYGGEGEGAKPV